MKRVSHGAAAIAVLCSMVAVASTADAAPDTGKLQHAYTIAQNCYATYVYGRLPDKAQQALQMSSAIGHALGKSDSQIAEERASFGAMAQGDFARDSTSYSRRKSECAEVGL